MDPLTYEIVLFESNSPISWIAAPPLKIYLHTSDKMDRGYELIDLFFSVHDEVGSATHNYLIWYPPVSSWWFSKLNVLLTGSMKSWSHSVSGLFNVWPITSSVRFSYVTENSMSKKKKQNLKLFQSIWIDHLTLTAFKSRLQGIGMTMEFTQE